MIAVAGKADVNRIDALYPDSRWEAKLCLGLTLKDGKTILSKRRHDGPLTIQRPFYPEKNDTCHLYILHPPGGIVGGDSLTIDVECSSDTSTLITTPAANKYYRSAGFTAWQSQSFFVKNSATLEWLPQETILFDGCKVRSKAIVNLEENANFFGWEIVSFGRPACNEEFTKGWFKQSIEIWRDDEPLLIDRVDIKDRADVFNALWGLGKKPAMGLLTIVTNNTSDLDKARQEIHAMIKDVCSMSVTVIGKMLICRCLDINATTIRETFIELWKQIRFMLLKKPPSSPRIWAT